ncbi:DUF7217 family protein [Aliivibrio fischeri]|uniref:DUF7217 domain-containing protein n=1 Tax=Aliivibrio fischeri TaxID=668 RepID=A0A510UF69_ALIFS|nr:hypothetical protein [Aliivibrio fischeri]GEK13217.1 hypothetical protein AFI02nite_12530 [Aliivibrio fischeri]
MNPDIYNTIKDKGLRLSSPTLNAITETESEINLALSAIDRLPILIPPALTGVSQSFVDKTKASLNAAIKTTTQARSSIKDGLNNVFSSITESSLVNNLDGTNGTCSNLTQLTGSLTGEIDESLGKIKAVATSLINHVDDYLNNIIDEIKLETLTGALTSKLDPLNDAITTIFSKERALSAEIKNKLESSSLAGMIEDLWLNPCSKPLLDQLLPSDLKELLP